MTDVFTKRWARIPVELRDRPQWCLAGADKRPLAIDGRNASVADPSTWTDFDTASRSAAQRGLEIGFVITEADPLACIDLDVKDASTHPDKPHVWTTAADIDRYSRIVASFDSYAELSRSGKGAHVWVHGRIGKGKRRDGVEAYSQQRFIICTGNTLVLKPVRQQQRLLEVLVAEMNRGSALEIELEDDDPDGDQGWYVAQQAQADTGEMGRLFKTGDWQSKYPSQSEADLALVTMLARLTSSNEQCWDAFRCSALGKRDKAKRTDYRRRTLTMARTHLANDAVRLAHGQEMANSLFWQLTGPSASPQTNVTDRHFGLLSDGALDQLPRLRWLVKRIIPDAGIGAIYGDSGTFKSFLTLDALAHVSNGQDWFGHRVKAAPAVYVPFEGQGGIPNRIKAWRLAQAVKRHPDILLSVVPPDDVCSHIAVIMDPMNLREPADRDKLVATLTENGWAGGVLCIDTLAHASNGIDENSSAMGEMLTIFRDLQYRLGGVILVIHHSGKNQDKGMRGWSGLHAAMDFIIECQHDKGAGHHDAQFVLTKVKDGETGRAYTFTMQIVHLGFDEDGDCITSLVVVPSDEDASAIFSTKPDADRDNDDDEFVWHWVKREVERNEYPSGRSLEGQREKQMSQDHVMTQKRLRDAIHRLRAASRLVDAADKAPSGNVYMLAVDEPQAAEPGAL